MNKKNILNKIKIFYTILVSKEEQVELNKISSPKYSKLILFFILSFASYFRFYNINAESLWIDELFTAYETHLDMSILESLQASWISKVNAIPPFYFYIIQIWTRFFGLSEFILRSFSAICGVLSIYVFYLLAKQFIDKQFALIASTFLTISNFHIYYSQEARPYTLYLFLSILSFLFLYKFHYSNKLKYITFYVLTCTCMLYTHIYAVFIYVSQLFILFIYLRPFYRVKIKDYIFLLFFLPIILFLPWLKILFIHAGNATSQVYGEPLNLIGLALIFTSLLYNQLLLVLSVIVGFFFIVINNKANQLFIYSASILLFCMILPFLISILYKPFFISRYFIGMLPSGN